MRDLSPYTSPESLREGVEKCLGRTVSDDVWFVLEKSWSVSDALERSLREDQEQFILDLLPPKRSYSEMPSVDRNEHSDDPNAVNVSLESKERKRAQAYAAYVTRWISSYEDVWGFRKRYLESETLSAEKAFDFLESPALRFMSESSLKNLGISALNHKSSVVENNFAAFGDQSDFRVKLWLDPPGTYKTVQYAPLDQRQIGALFIPAQYPSEHEPIPKSPHSKKLEYRGRKGEKRSVYPWPGSVLYLLSDAAQRLSRTLGWEMQDVVWLLLTGSAPYLNPFKVQLNYSRGKPATVKMEIAAWMPATIVATKLRDLQREILTVGVGKISELALDVCIFVEEHIQDANESAIWPDLCHKWNKANPDRKYGNPRSFRQIYFRNMPTIAQSYNVPSISPEAEKRNRAATAKMIEDIEKLISRDASTEHQPR